MCVCGEGHVCASQRGACVMCLGVGACMLEGVCGRGLCMAVSVCGRGGMHGRGCP